MDEAQPGAAAMSNKRDPPMVVCPACGDEVVLFSFKRHRKTSGCRMGAVTKKMQARGLRDLMGASIEYGDGGVYEVRGELAKYGIGIRIIAPYQGVQFWVPSWIVALLEDQAHRSATYEGMGLSEVIQEWLTHNPELPR